ncbi:MAG: SMC-Scp complex subunit ScpB, partial [Bradyrhizobium sp.]|nr:SMC-Scp complex subunit ScpB [Bradyrhizobium sp.]
QVVGDLELSAADAEAEIAEVSLEVQELDGDALKDLALEAEELIAEQDDEVVAELVDATAEAEGEAELSDEAEAEIDGEAADDEGDRDTGEDDSSHRG